MAEKTLVLLRASAKEIVVDVLRAAQAEGFLAFAELPERVRLNCLGSLIDLSADYCQARLEDHAADMAGSDLSRMAFLQKYADTEVHRHRQLGIKLGDFLILLKHYRVAFRRHLEQQAQREELVLLGLNMIEAMFDALEIACGGAWARQAQQAQQAHGEAIQQRDDFWAAVFSAVNDAVFIHDAQSGRALFVNEAAMRMYGAAREEMVEVPIEKFSVGDEQVIARQIGQKMRQVMAQGAQNFEWLARRADGREFWVDVGLSPMKNGAREYVVAVVRDIDAQKRSEQAAQKNRQKMHEAQRLESLGLLAGGIAHDFNNLLTSIMGNAELMRLNQPVDPDSRSCLDSIEQASEKAAELCQQMLHFAGTGLVNKGAVSVSTIVYDSIHEIREGRQSKIPVAVEIEAGLPAVVIDRAQLMHVLINLLLNAIESTVDVERAKITISAFVRHCDGDCTELQPVAREFQDAEHSRGDYLCLEVSDNGSGMTPETQRKIFEPFFSTKFFGRGLGLAAVAGIARSYKGFVGVSSQKGKGSTVSLSLPMAEIAPGYVSVKKAANTVLLIDDDDEVLSVGARMLKMLDFDVLQAENGARGLEIFADNKADICCVLTDLSMPVLDGVETVRRIFSIKPDLPVVMMSGYDATRAAQRFGGETSVVFVQKPFSLNKIKMILQEALGREIA